MSAGLEGRPDIPVGFGVGCEGQIARCGVGRVLLLLLLLASMELMSLAQRVDLSGDWCRSVGGGGGFSDGWSEMGDGSISKPPVGGSSGSVKFVWRERSQRTTSWGLEGAWFGLAEVRWPGSRRERKESEPSEQKV